MDKLPDGGPLTPTVDPEFIGMGDLLHAENITGVVARGTAASAQSAAQEEGGPRTFEPTEGDSDNDVTDIANASDFSEDDLMA
mmetsp:Transcript_27318/g.59815  ORF Transcript_27318/g.59815 Transcript_27318/m.59815 type:complete len:83 (-) Transcript_27318:186-434(-)